MPPGFRFHPRDEELIIDYLAKRIFGETAACPMMVDVDLNKVEPWDLPGEACVGGKEWYFYSLRDRKYATGQRTNRATMSGYWKATGKDRHVTDGRRGGKLVGMRKTLVFYQGRAPKGRKTDWVMHEFRMEGPGAPGGDGGEGSNKAAAAAAAGAGGASSSSAASSSTAAQHKEDWVLCRVFFKSRGLSTKPNASTGTATADDYYNTGADDTGSSSLPPLMDTYINFEQPAPPQASSLQGYHEHVPCFSSLPSSSSRHNHLSTMAPHFQHSSAPLMMGGGLPMRSFTQLIGGTGVPSLHDLSSFGGLVGPYTNDKKDIKVVLDHLSKTEGATKSEIVGPPSRDMVDGSSTSFLNEPGGHAGWPF